MLNPPKPIDLSSARTASLALDLDLDLSDEEAVAERHLAGSGEARRTLVGRNGRGYEPIFQDDLDGEGEGGEDRDAVNRRAREDGTRRPLDVGGQKGRETLNEEDEDAWDRFG